MKNIFLVILFGCVSNQVVILTVIAKVVYLTFTYIFFFKTDIKYVFSS